MLSETAFGGHPGVNKASDRGLTSNLLGWSTQQAVTTLQAGYPETRRLTLPTSTAKGSIVNPQSPCEASELLRGGKVTPERFQREG